MKQNKVKMSRPELKRQRDTLARYERFLPTLKLKHQLLQQKLIEAHQDLHIAIETFTTCHQRVEEFGMLQQMPKGIDVEAFCKPVEVTIRKKNVAGVNIPIFEQATFPEVSYSTMFTPPYVDMLLKRMTQRVVAQLQQEVEQKRFNMLRKEFTRVNQRLNLFEKRVIPQTKDAIHRIRVHLGDEQTAAVGRAKLAKGKRREKPTLEYNTLLNLGAPR